MDPCKYFHNAAEMNATRGEVVRHEMKKTFLKPVLATHDNQFLVKSDFACSIEDLSEAIKQHINVQREQIDSAYEDCLKNLPANCTSFHFTSPNGEALSSSSEFGKQFENLRVVYATAIIAANSATKLSDDDSSAAKKSLLLFAEVGGISILPELGKVKLVSVRAKPNQLLSAGIHQELQLSLPPREQLFDLKSTEAQQLLVHEQSLVHIENDPRINLIPVHVSHENGRKFSATSMTCLPITFDPHECELVSVVEDKVICQKLSESRAVLDKEVEEKLPPHVQQLWSSFFHVADDNGSNYLPFRDSGFCLDVDSQKGDRTTKRRSGVNSSKSPGRKRGRPKKTGASRASKCSKLEDGNGEEALVPESEVPELKARHSRRKPKTEGKNVPSVKDRLVDHSKTAMRRFKQCVKVAVGMMADAEPEDWCQENVNSFEAKDEPTSKVDLLSNLLVLADAASISFRQIGKEDTAEKSKVNLK